MGYLRIFILFVALLVGCQKERENPFFRQWTADDGSVSLDLSSGHLGSSLGSGSSGSNTFTATVYDIPSANTCTCQVLISGDYGGGEYSISSCETNGMVSSGSMCMTGQFGTYSWDGSALTLCKDNLPSQCLVYR